MYYNPWYGQYAGLQPPFVKVASSIFGDPLVMDLVTGRYKYARESWVMGNETPPAPSQTPTPERGTPPPRVQRTNFQKFRTRVGNVAKRSPWLSAAALGGGTLLTAGTGAAVGRATAPPPPPPPPRWRMW